MKLVLTFIYFFAAVLGFSAGYAHEYHTTTAFLCFLLYWACWFGGVAMRLWDEEPDPPKVTKAVSEPVEPIAFQGSWQWPLESSWVMTQRCPHCHTILKTTHLHGRTNSLDLAYLIEVVKNLEATSPPSKCTACGAELTKFEFLSAGEEKA